MQVSALAESVRPRMLGEDEDALKKCVGLNMRTEILFHIGFMHVSQISRFVVSCFREKRRCKNEHCVQVKVKFNSPNRACDASYFLVWTALQAVNQVACRWPSTTPASET